jgi:hypothetical protein
MKYRIISSIYRLIETIEYFNDFHDGFLKSMKLVSGNKFMQQPPWEKPKIYESIEDKLNATFIMCYNKKAIENMKGLFLEIHHFNYDWPNKMPNNKIILYMKNVGSIDPALINLVGSSILDCEAVKEDDKLALIFTFEIFEDSQRKKTKIKLVFDKIFIREIS